MNVNLLSFILFMASSYSYSSQFKTQKETDNPYDTVSSIAFNCFEKKQTAFLAASWDGFVRYYQFEVYGSNKILAKKWEHFFNHPVLSCDLTSNMLVVAGLASGQIMVVDMANSNNMILLGLHDSPICKVIWCQEHGIVISLGYDNLIKCFNFECVNNTYLKAEFKLPAKTFTASFSYPFLLIGSNQAKIGLISIENPSNISIPTSYFDIDLNPASKLMTSSIHAGQKKIAFGTVDGMFIYTDFSSNYSGMKVEKPVQIKHQKKTPHHYSLTGQVNSVDISVKDRKYCFCAIGGSEDGGMHEINKNRKLKNLTNSSTVTAVKVSPDSEYVVFALGSDWAKGLNELTESKKPKLIGMRLNSSDIYT